MTVAKRSDLPARLLSKAQLIARGADGHLTCGVERFVPLDKLDGLEPEPANNESDDGLYHAGRRITQPIEVAYDAALDVYMVYGGNHRIAQARANGQTHIAAFVEPDRTVSRHAIGQHTVAIDPDAALWPASGRKSGAAP